jgi:polysaccharide biosynthesis protein PslG
MLGRTLHRIGLLAAAGFLFLSSLLASMLPAVAQSEPDAQARFHPETGFWVTSPFVDYWEANGGLMTFGYPLSRVFYQDGLHRQYFERAIFERHENHAGTPHVVQLARLGAINTSERQRFDDVFQPVAENARLIDDGAQHFPETGHHLGGVFRAYWHDHGGLQTFGYPLSEPFVEPGVDGVPRTTQYFERARFEHHLEHAGTPFEVLLGHLGREALAQRSVPPAALQPQRPTAVDRDSPPLGPLPTREPGSVSCGFVFSFWGNPHDDERNAHYLDMMAASGCAWVRMSFPWAELEPTPDAVLRHRLWPLRNAVDQAKSRGLRVLVTISTAPEWALPDDPAMLAYPEPFGEMMGTLAHELRGKVDAWQIWNEPNIIAETNGLIDPAGFFPLLKAAYPAIKAADPEALVVFPGLAPCSLMLPDLAMDNTWYLESLLRMNNGEAAGYFDVLAVHPYGAANEPDTYWPGNLSVLPEWVAAPEFYFRGAERSRRVMVELGLEHKPIWFTEMGWPVGAYNPVWGYGRWITNDLQRQYLVRAFEIMRTEWDWVEVAFVFILNAEEYGGTSNNPFVGFSLIRADRTPRPAFTAMSELSDIWQQGNER